MRSLEIGPAELVGAALSTQWGSLAMALVVTVVILALLRRSSQAPAGEVPVPPHYARERRLLGVVAITVIAVLVAESVARGYFVNLVGVVSWWRVALPVACAAAGLFVLLGAVVTRGTPRPEVPAADGARRTWLSFGPRADIVTGGIALVLLLLTTFAAGFASSPDDRGRYVWLAIPVPNEAAIDPIRMPFYGWAYGLPVLGGLAALTAVTWLVLHRNASRPYLRPETVIGERRGRSETAGGAVHIAVAGVVLAFAGAWRLIAGAGTVSRLIVEGQNNDDPYDVTWRYAEFAAAGGWLAPILEVSAFTLLLIVAARFLRRPRSHPLSDRSSPVAHEASAQ